MANVFTSQILMDGDQKVVVHCVGTLDTSDLAATTVLDPATLQATNPLSTQLRIDRIRYDVEPTLSVAVLWDATADVVAYQCTGTLVMDATPFGGLQNNAGAGKTGKIQLSTQGWAASAVLQFDITIEATKQ
jgi:hypothetical protein